MRINDISKAVVFYSSCVTLVAGLAGFKCFNQNKRPWLEALSFIPILFLTD